jgi:hypothetical protein
MYGTAAYVLVPLIYERTARQRLATEEFNAVTATGDGHPGDPLNVALIGTAEQLQRLLLAAGYAPADPLTWKSSLGIGEAAVLGRPYTQAPVSNLYLFGRKQDFAFERAVGDSPRRRHHVRFWKTPAAAGESRPLWVGQTSFDQSVGISHATGQITHHISPDVDAERDYLFGRLRATARLESDEVVPDFHRTRFGINGGGDRWITDGSLYLGTIRDR